MYLIITIIRNSAMSEQLIKVGAGQLESSHLAFCIKDKYQQLNKPVDLINQLF
jgi:hypothetical protein